MEKMFKEAHKMTREMVKEYKVDYQAQFGLNLSYLLEEKGEVEMIKDYIEARGYKIVVENNSLKFYQDNKVVAETWGFINSDSTKEHEGRIALKLNKHEGPLKKYGWLLIEVNEFEELLNIRQRILVAIDSYFDNLDNVELYELSNGAIVFMNGTEEYKKLKELNSRYFYDKEELWIKENKKYFNKKVEWEKNEMGMMESNTTYTFTKENIEKVDKEIKEYKNTEEYKEKQRDRLEREKNYMELEKLARELSDEDFEDVTGLSKDFVLGR